MRRNGVDHGGGNQNKELFGLYGRIRSSDNPNSGYNPTQDVSLVAADVQARVRGPKFFQGDCAWDRQSGTRLIRATFPHDQRHQPMPSPRRYVKYKRSDGLQNARLAKDFGYSGEIYYRIPFLSSPMLNQKTKPNVESSGSSSDIRHSRTAIFSSILRGVPSSADEAQI